MTESWEFFAEHSKWLSDNWSASPEGRAYKANFDTHVAMLRHDHYVVELLVAAGHVSPEQVAQARAIADAVARIPANVA